MAKSDIIKKIVIGEIPLDISLKKLGLLLSDFNKPELEEWINNELCGYNDSQKVPDYRKQPAEIYRDPFIQNGSEKEVFVKESELEIKEGINTLLLMIKNKKDIKINFKYYDIENVSRMHTACKVCLYTNLQNIINNVENKVRRILIALEDEFGVLDDLDIDTAGKNMDDIGNKVSIIIYGGNIQFNNSNGNSSISATQNNGVNSEELNEIISNITKSLTDVKSQDDRNEIKNKLDILKDELKSDKPKKPILKEYIDFFERFLKELSESSALATNVITLINFIRPFINN